MPELGEMLKPQQQCSKPGLPSMVCKGNLWGCKKTMLDRSFLFIFFLHKKKAEIKILNSLICVLTVGLSLREFLCHRGSMAQFLHNAKRPPVEPLNHLSCPAMWPGKWIDRVYYVLLNTCKIGKWLKTSSKIKSGKKILSVEITREQEHILAETSPGLS